MHTDLTDHHSQQECLGALPCDVLPDQSDVSPDQSRLNPSTETTVAEKIKEILAPFLRSLDLELFSLQLSGNQVRIFIDKTGGVNLDDCAQLSRLLGPAFDVSDCFPDHYTLEVSSPGIDRPLLKKEDYSRFIGSRVKIKTSSQIMNQKVFVGQLADFDGETIHLATDEGSVHQIPFDAVFKARLEVAFPREQKRRG